MATKEFKATTKETADLLKKLATEVPETSNAEKYSKFLQRTLREARTFDKESPTYVDYVAKSMTKSSKPKSITEKKKEKVAVAPEKTTEAAKRKTDSDDEGRVKKVVTKKAKVT